MSLLRQSVDFLNYYLNATNRHGLHSPFIYSLNEAVFRYDRKDIASMEAEAIRKSLLQDNRMIEVQDYGAGHNGELYTKRKVSDIVRSSSKSPRYCRLLYRLVKYLQPERMIELGTAAGISAYYQCMGNPHAELITLEGSPSIAEIARYTLKDCNARVITGKFDDTLPSLLQEGKKFNYVFIDGHHQGDALIKYFRLILPFLTPESVVVIDDINWSDDMRNAWNELKEDPSMQVSVDLFQLGLLFRRPGLSKEDFTIRY